MNDSPIRNVSDTAFMVAAFRARETERTDSLFKDPLASRLAGKEGRKIIESLPSKAFLGGWTVVIRTRMIDDFIHEAILGGVSTILNLGAGLDARPYRMDLPQTIRWVEVDFPHVIDLKESRLSNEKPRCQLERVRLDLSNELERRNFLEKFAGESKNILVLTEGVIPYLSEGSVSCLLQELRKHNSFRYFVADYFSPASYDYRRRSGMSRTMKNAPFIFEPIDYFEFFSQNGWRPKEIRYFTEEAEKLNRPAPFPPMVKLVTFMMGLIAPPERRRAMKQFAGFVWFERV